MSDLQIVRPRLAFEREFGQHRNWWVRGDVLTGNALKVLLTLMSHDQGMELSQTAVQRDIGLGESAWRSAKECLMRAGFLVEIRDRYPNGSRRADGSPCGGQKRWRLVLQDPEEGTVVDLDDAIIESAVPVTLVGETPGQSQSRKSRVAAMATRDNQEWVTKPQVTATRDNQEWTKSPVDNSSATLDYQESFIGREEMGLDMDGINTSNPIPSPGMAPLDAETIAGIDSSLKTIHPSLSFAALDRQVRGRVNLREINLFVACREILDANKQPGGVRHPAAYIAKSLVASPERWGTYEPYIGLTELEEFADAFEATSVQEDCDAGRHHWGHPNLPELQRAHCTYCGRSRREVDSVFAELEEEFERNGGYS